MAVDAAPHNVPGAPAALARSSKINVSAVAWHCDAEKSALSQRLSVAGKLLVSACWTIGLVSLLAVLLRLDMIHLATAGTTAASATAAGREVSAAMMDALRLRLITQELPGEQTAEAIEASLARALQDATLLQSHIQFAGKAVPAGEIPALAKVDPVLKQLNAAIGAEAEQRRTLLALRDGAFWTLHDQLLVNIGQARSDVVLEDLAASDIDNLTAYLSEYQASIDAVEYGTMSFLATGQVKFMQTTRQAMATGQARMADIDTAHLSPYTEAELFSLEHKRLTFQERADSLLNSINTMDHQVADVVRTDHMLLALISEASQDLEARSTAAYLAAAEARHQLLQANVYLSSSAIALIVIGNLLILRTIVQPMRVLTRLMQAMARGEVEQPVPPTKRRDEIGAMMQALELFRCSVRDAFVQSQIIGQLPIGVMTVELDHASELGYVNSEADRLLQAALEMPGQSLAGHSVDCLRSTMLAALRTGSAQLPCTERILLGTQSFDLGISTVTDIDGGRSSVMLTLSPRSKQVDLLNRFETSIAQIAGGVSRSSVSVRHSAASMFEAAVDGQEKTTAVAAATGQAGRKVQAIAGTIEQLARLMGETTTKIEMSLAVANLAATEATQADSSVDHLGEAAERIGGVVRLIAEIAGRTKLLALNAAIEAARAGESGLGFAVVAAEVKALATQTAVATAEISDQVTAMQGTSRNTMDVLKNVAVAIRRMSDMATSMLSEIGEQRSALDVIVDAVKDIRSSSGDVAATVTGVRQIVSDTEVKAQNVLDAATALSHQAETLTSEAAVFLSAIQAAA